MQNNSNDNLIKEIMVENSITEKEEYEFFEDWYLLEKYAFKILSVITILADEKRAYRGTLNDICEILEIQSSSGNKQKIKETLEWLATNNYVRIILDNTTYTISLAVAAEKDVKIIKIKKAWYTLIRKNSGKNSWVNTLKVFLKIKDMSTDEIITCRELGAQLNMSVATVQRCAKTITSIDFIDFKIFSKAINKKTLTGEYYGLGKTYNKMLIFESKQ